MTEHLTGDGPCADCGGPNIVWYCDDLLWNRVVRDRGPECVLCVHCFVGRAEKHYDVQAWHLGIAPVMNARATEFQRAFSQWEDVVSKINFVAMPPCVEDEAITVDDAYDPDLMSRESL